MPRLARTVFAGLPHHVTQRGNRREDVFFADEDRRTYLDWLRAYCDEHRVEILAYCLMTNHVHLVVVPDSDDGLQRALKPLHMRYAQRINRGRGWHGHLWQGRFFSSSLDEAYLWAALRYVERNPVRARMVRRAENYVWSSAAAHCGRCTDPALTQAATWRERLAAVDDWSAWLAEGDEAEELAVLRRNADKGLPCGSETFIGRLEALSDRPLRFRPIGRPRTREADKETNKG
jgi:REP-associated tyrosine transposase